MHRAEKVTDVAELVRAVRYVPPMTGHRETHLMKPREVCDLLNIAMTTLRDWRERGDIDAHQLETGYWRYPADQEPIRRALAAVRTAP